MDPGFGDRSRFFPVLVVDDTVLDLPDETDDLPDETGDPGPTRAYIVEGVGARHVPVFIHQDDGRSYNRIGTPVAETSGAVLTSFQVR